MRVKSAVLQGGLVGGSEGGREEGRGLLWEQLGTELLG